MNRGQGSYPGTQQGRRSGITRGHGAAASPIAPILHGGSVRIQRHHV